MKTDYLNIIPHKPAGSSPFVKKQGRLIEFSRFRFYLLLHGIFIGLILLYQSFWFFFSEKTMASSNVYWGPYKELRVIEPGTVLYYYQVDGETYSGETTRNGMPLTQQTIGIRYLTFSPSISRPDNYASNWMGFQIAWLIFFVITSMIFFIPNDTMPRNSYFYFTRKKPWIHMIIK